MNLEVSAEHSPMSGIDEYLIHNYPHPVRVMWTSDPRAYERLWFTAQDKVGEVFFVCGLGFYPESRHGRGLRVGEPQRRASQRACASQAR